MKNNLSSRDKVLLLVVGLGLIFTHFYHGNAMVLNGVTILIFACAVGLVLSILQAKQSSHDDSHEG